MENEMNEMVIAGAGFAGMIAAEVFKNATIVDSMPCPKESHRALLRFRSNEVGRLFGIDFKKVIVNKGIWDIGKHDFVNPNILLANHYSLKVSGTISDRSIWNLEQSERYVAPDDLYEQLIEKNKNRIIWKYELKNIENKGCLISTIPMSAMAKITGTENSPEFKFKEVTVLRCKIKNCNVFQTVYIPSPNTNCYRISITGDLLIAEFVGPNIDNMIDVFEPFGIDPLHAELFESKHKQKYGKISPIDDQWRRAFLHMLTVNHGIYSIGRFATWRNILLDDVVKDAFIIKKMIEQDSYGLFRAATNV